jgi:hypothetical protein
MIGSKVSYRTRKTRVVVAKTAKIRKVPGKAIWEAFPARHARKQADLNSLANRLLIGIFYSHSI